MKFTHKLTSPEYITKVRYACKHVCVCRHNILSQEELWKVMSDSMNTENVEVCTYVFACIKTLCVSDKCT